MPDSDAEPADNPYNRNPEGRNQHKDCPAPDDERINALLVEYHRRGHVSGKQISKLPWAEHGIKMSRATVDRRRSALELKSSGITTSSLPVTVKRQLVLDQMAQDPTRRRGPKLLVEAIAREHGIHLTRDYVTSEMRLHDPVGLELREPTAKKIFRQALVVLGLHHERSGDGHDKLTKIGFPVWALRDVWSGKWLGIWVVPNNRLKLAIAYLYLSLVEMLGGMPIQTTTDCGTETITVFGMANALRIGLNMLSNLCTDINREYFSPELSTNEVPAHKFLKSVHNTTIERGWLQLRLQWGDDVKVFWEAGNGIYNSSIPEQYELVQWLWPKLIQQELDELRDRFNNHRVQKDRNKVLPSGVSPNEAFTLHEEYGAENLLQPVNKGVVRELMVSIGGDDLIRFVSVEYAVHAQEVYYSLGIQKLTMFNVWTVFQAMLPLM
ncbi:hypothetical protein JB92DRAFT_3149094 [Gautieria morchelliformis]|nr:hypothetical protein JB92DRAFT_3149094 [Gautieria morchelliformis]